MVNSPLIRPYLLGGVALGGYLRFPCYDSQFLISPILKMVYIQDYNYNKPWLEIIGRLSSFLANKNC